MDELTTYLTKSAEAAHTHGMELTKADKAVPKGKKAVVNKTAGAMLPHIDVSDLEPSPARMQKQAKYYAMPSQAKYPLDGYDQVIKAAAYFDHWQGQMDPAHKREFCHNLVKRASAIGVDVSPTVRKYGADTYAPAADFEIAVAGRRGIVKEAHQLVLDELVASQPQLSPDDFAVTLGEFDKVAGIDHLYGQEILDPWFSTFGEKVAADSAASLKKSKGDDDKSYVFGNEMVTGKALKDLAATSSKSLNDTFGADFMKEFRKEPITIFESMPLDQKKILCRMANDNSPK